jgi:hypothetical protein
VGVQVLLQRRVALVPSAVVPAVVVVQLLLLLLLPLVVVLVVVLVVEVARRVLLQERAHRHVSPRLRMVLHRQRHLLEVNTPVRGRLGVCVRVCVCGRVPWSVVWCVAQAITSLGERPEPQRAGAPAHSQRVHTWPSSYLVPSPITPWGA